MLKWKRNKWREYQCFGPSGLVLATVYATGSRLATGKWRATAAGNPVFECSTLGAAKAECERQIMKAIS